MFKLSVFVALLVVIILVDVATPEYEYEVELNLSEFEMKLSEAKKKYRYIATESSELGFIHSDIYLSRGFHGIGVFTSKFIPKHNFIEVSPALLIPKLATKVTTSDCDGETINAKNHNILLDYVFSSPIPDYKLVVLGWSMVYNHCDEPNIASEIFNFPDDVVAPRNNRYGDFAVMFASLRDIEAGEELCWDYGKGYWEYRSNPDAFDAASI